jgi:hypothetical protein
MQAHIEHIIQRCQQFLGLDGLTSRDISFQDWREIGSQDRGIYVIYSNSSVIYVGKGIIRSRQDKHWQKALAEFRDARDTVGWQWLREHTAVEPAQWRLQVITVAQSTARSALEGTLIHLLQPLANDEVYEDRRCQ